MVDRKRESFRPGNIMELEKDTHGNVILKGVCPKCGSLMKRAASKTVFIDFVKYSTMLFCSQCDGQEWKEIAVERG